MDSIEFNPGHIGHIVYVQVFRINLENPSEILPQSLTKHVGLLEGYCEYSNKIRFWLKGDTPVTISKRRHIYEVYVKDTK